MTPCKFARRRRMALGAALCAFAPASLPTWAQASYPNRPIRLIVPFPAGAMDTLARILARALTASLGQPVVVENRPGAGGNIGMEAGAKATNDGYTLVMGAISMLTAPMLSPALGYEPVKDFAPLGMLATTANVLVAHPDVPFKTVKEMVAYAKANPGKLTYASSGNATLSHLLGAWLNAEAGIDLVHVPYRGGSQAAVDVISGRVPLWFDNVATGRSNVDAGKLRAIAVTSATRSPLMPDVPTFAESGYPGLVGGSWWALFAPAGTARAITQRLTDETAKALQTPDSVRDLAGLGLTPAYSTPDQFAAFFRAETIKWKKIIADANIKGDG